MIHTDQDFIKRYESLNFEFPDYELLVLGTSFAQYGIDTELLTAQGIKSYNLAIAGNSFKTCYIQLNEYLTKYSQRPRYVLLAFNSSREIENSENIQPVVEVTMKDYHYNLKNAPISKFGWMGTELFKKAVSKKHREVRLSYGQVKFEKCTPDNTTYSMSVINVNEIEANRWIGEIARLCDQNGIEMIIIDMPGFKETQNLSEIGPYKLEFLEGGGATFYNYRSRDFCEIFDTREDWIGNSHLNEFGGAKFTKEFIMNFDPL